MSSIGKIQKYLRDGTLSRRVLSRANKWFKSMWRSKGPEEPVGDSYYGNKAEAYLKTRLKQEYWQLEQDTIKALLAEYPDQLTVLDVPFGTGRFAAFYAGKKMTVHGLDSSQDMLSVAKKELEGLQLKCDLKVGDAGRLPYENDSVDLVVCFRFLSHVVPYSIAKVILKELQRVTRSDMILQLRVRKDDAAPVPEPLPEEPMNDRLNLGDIKKMLSQAGFGISQIKNLETRNTYYRAVFVCKKNR